MDFFYNNTQAVAEGETAQQGLVPTGWGNWKWQQVEHNVGSQKPHNHHSSAAASRHTQSRDQAEATPVELRYLHPSLTHVSSIQNKKHHIDEQTTAPVHKIQLTLSTHTFKCKDCWVDLSAGFSLQIHDLGIVISACNVGAFEIFIGLSF